jgi:hypothetical protein
LFPVVLKLEIPVVEPEPQFGLDTDPLLVYCIITETFPEGTPTSSKSKVKSIREDDCAEADIVFGSIQGCPYPANAFLECDPLPKICSYISFNERTEDEEIEDLVELPNSLHMRLLFGLFGIATILPPKCLLFF